MADLKSEIWNLKSEMALRDLMRKVLVLLTVACMAGASVGALKAAPRDRELHDLKKRQKQQRKTLKIQQRSMKRTMKRQQLPPDSRKRFRRQLKMERHVLRTGQREERKEIGHGRAGCSVLRARC